MKFSGMYKFFTFFMCVVMACGGAVCDEVSDALTPQQRADYILGYETPMVYIRPETIDAVLRETYGGENPEYNINYLHAAEYYDRVSSEQDGKVSVEQLFMVCVIARGRSEISAKYASGADLITKEWPICVEEFIQPLIDVAEETAILDNYMFEVYSGTAFNEACTPSQKQECNKDSCYPNMICSSGKHANDPAFQKAMDTIFRKEGGCDDANDGKGLTCFGVAGFDHPEVYYAEFSRSDAEDMAYKLYYKRHNVDKLPDSIRGDVLMGIWASGSQTAIGLLQDVLGVTRTRKIDEETIEAAKNYNGSASLRKRFLQMRVQHMKSINKGKSWKNYGGWARSIVLGLENGCHTVPTNPLVRDKKSIAECSKHLGKIKTQADKDAFKQTYIDNLRSSGKTDELNTFLGNVAKAKQNKK